MNVQQAKVEQGTAPRHLQSQATRLADGEKVTMFFPQPVVLTLRDLSILKFSIGFNDVPKALLTDDYAAERRILIDLYKVENRTPESIRASEPAPAAEVKEEAKPAQAPAPKKK